MNDIRIEAPVNYLEKPDTQKGNFPRIRHDGFLLFHEHQKGCEEESLRKHLAQRFYLDKLDGLTPSYKE